MRRQAPRQERPTGLGRPPRRVLGNTAEFLLVENAGCRARGHPAQGPLNHATGKGWVREFRGAYDDGLRVKRNSLVMWIVETSGAVHSDGVSEIYRLHHLGDNNPSARDGTRYDRSRCSTTSFATHHLQCISTAAVTNSVNTILAGAKSLTHTAVRAARAAASCGDARPHA